MVTTTALLEQRLRIDLEQQQAGNGANTTDLDDSRGLDLIIGDANELQFALLPYEVRHAPGTRAESGFADGSMFRFEQRPASSPGDGDHYVLSAWIQVQAPGGIQAYTNADWQLEPTFAFGKGWGDFDVQGTIAALLPTSNTKAIGEQAQTNIALQYHLFNIVWPKLEANWTYYGGGPRNALNQPFLTPGIVLGRFDVSHAFKFTFGIGYQTAVARITGQSRLRPLMTTPGSFPRATISGIKPETRGKLALLRASLAFDG